MILTPKFPLSFDDSYGYSNAQTTVEVVNFHLKNLLLTNPGEKISDLNYGVGVKQYLFEQIEPGILNLISDRIFRAIKIHLGYLEQVSVNISSQVETNTIRIKISYIIPGLSGGTFNLDVESGANY